MKILLISEYSSERRSNRILLGFLSRLNEFFDVNLYGPVIGKDDYEYLREIKFDFDTTIRDVENKLKPDLILYNTIRIPYTEGSFLNDFEHKAPLVVMHGDSYSYDKNLTRDKNLNMFEFYKRCKVDLVISNTFISWDYPVEYVFLPRSANELEFYDDEEEREDFIAFAGSSINKFPYETRFKALYELNKCGLLSPKKIGKMESDYYPRYLREYTGALSCSGDRLHTPLAKHFEIMLSGTALLSTEMYTEDRLFGNKICYFKYKDDCSDVVNIARKILNDKNLTEEVTNNAKETISKYHTHENRIEEIKDILVAFYEGKRIPKKWQ